MTKKTLTTILTILFILPVICLAQEVEIGEVKLRWKKVSGNSRLLLAQIPVTNHTEELCGLKGKLLFCDKDGFTLNGILFMDNVEAEQSKTIQTKGLLYEDDYAETATLKLDMEMIPLTYMMQGKPPLKIERTLTLPPWD